MMIPCLEITYENTQRFFILRSIGLGKTLFCLNFSRAGPA